jgi:ABC-2 type transport system ATP-binding protein
MIEALEITKYYGRSIALDNVSFRIEMGQVLGYLGPNGSGKSTTVKILVGLLQPSHGRVLCNGQDIQSDLAGYKKRVGYVPEEPNLYPYLTGYEYLEMIGIFRAISRPIMTAKIDRLLELFSLSSHRHMALSSYSKGMRQRISIIAAIMDNPDLLIFDEPLSGLDVTTALIFTSLIKEFSARGKIIFYCSHVLEVVEKVCSHLLLLKKGKVLAYGPVEEVHKTVGQSSIEQIFHRLLDDTDIFRTATQIVDVVVAPE